MRRRLLDGQLIAAGDGRRRAAPPHRHPARQAARHQAGGQQRHLLEELLDALDAEQRPLQLSEVARNVLVSYVPAHVRLLYPQRRIETSGSPHPGMRTRAGYPGRCSA